MTEAMYYILLALSVPQHGYAVMETVSDISRGRLVMGPGTLYGILTRLRKEKLIVLTEDDGRRKTYRLTKAGKDALQAEHTRLIAMVEDGQRLFDEVNEDE